MKENGRKGEKRENWSPKFYFLEKSPITVHTIGLYSHQDKKKYQKQQKHLTVTRRKWEEAKKMSQKRSRRQTAGEVNSG